MKKTLLLLSTSLIGFGTYSFAQVQIPFPTDVQFETYLKKEMPNLEKSTGISLAGLKRNSTGKVVEFRYPETSGYNFRAWPKDGCQKQYFYIVPEQKSGIGGYVEVNVNYRRSKCDGDDCTLTNKWEEKSVLGSFEYSRTKAFTKTEADSMAMRCVRYEKDSLLANVIKIKKIEPGEGMLYNDVPCYYNRINSFNEIEFSVTVSCEEAIYTKDYSLLVTKGDREKQLYFVMNFNGKNWVPVRRTDKKKITNEERYFMDEEKMNNSIYYTPLCKSSISAVYNKYNEAKPTGDNTLIKLQKRTKAFEDVLLAKDNSLKYTDLTMFLYKKDLKDMETKMQEWVSKYHNDYLNTTYIALKNSKTKHLENTELRNDRGYIVEGSYVLNAESQSILNSEKVKKKIKEPAEVYVTISWIYDDGDWYITSIR